MRRQPQEFRLTAKELLAWAVIVSVIVQVVKSCS